MPWCPACKAEYREGFRYCHECKKELVDEMLEGPAFEFEDMVYLGSFGDEAETKLLEAFLNSHGIPVLKKYQGIGGYLKITMAVSKFGVDFYVPSGALEEAQRLVNEMALEPPVKVGEVATEELASSLRWRKRMIVVIISLLFIIPCIAGVLYSIVSILLK